VVNLIFKNGLGSLNLD